MDNGLHAPSRVGRFLRVLQVAPTGPRKDHTPLGAVAALKAVVVAMSVKGVGSGPASEEGWVLQAESHFSAQGQVRGGSGHRECPSEGHGESTGASLPPHGWGDHISQCVQDRPSLLWSS